MKKTRKITRKGWATIIAAALVVAIVLTGTLAWSNMTQKLTNELLKTKNPGGRMHDDFNGEENKDIYAENFTDKETGAPVYVRVRLLEYMETGEEAGINRTIVNDEGETVTNPDRKVKPLIEGADINKTATWHVHKHGEDDPFHDFWQWEMGGETVYMPTFNKNKDSISVEANGTYVGADGDFETGEPYDDYKTYTIGDDVTAAAYYDVDDNSDDEYVEGTSPAPGAGGVKKDPTKTNQDPKPNYEEKEEKHTAQSTLKGLGVISMEDWENDGMPICNKWVYDVDGWFYWPEPVQPQTATGLLLNKVTQSVNSSDKCYYAIELEGQFIDSVKETDLGTPVEYEKNEDGTDKTDETGALVVKNPATGFYVDGVTSDAIELLTRATKVKVGVDDNWYFPANENHVFQQILDDEGNLDTKLVWWGEDGVLGTEDDRDDVIHIEGGVTSVEGNSHGEYFLPPRTEVPYEENYYQTAGPDGEFGTGDDGRLWLPAGGTFPSGVMDTVVDTVTVHPPAGLREVTEGETTLVEMEVGTTLANPFTAEVKLNGADAGSTAVAWSVAPMARARLAPGTKIGETTGVLSIDENETNSALLVTARSTLDNRKVGSYTVKVCGMSYVEIAPASGGAITQIQAGKSVTLKATVIRGGVAVSEQPASFTWSAVNTPAGRAAEPGAVKMNNGVLTVGRSITGTVTVTARCTVAGVSRTGTLTLTVTTADPITVTLTEPEVKSVEAGGELTYTATLDHTDELQDTGIQWVAGKSGDGGQTIETVAGVGIRNGVLTISSTYSITNNGNTVYVQAAAKDGSANGAKAVCTTPVTITGPGSVTVTAGKTKVKQGSNTTLTATVNNAAGEAYTSQEVDWSVTTASGGAVQAGTMVSGGRLYIDAAEEFGDLTVTATSKVDSSKKDTVTVTVDDGLLKIGNQKFYVLYTDAENHRALVLTKDCVTQMAYSTVDNFWESSSVRSYLNGSWLSSVSGLRNAIWKDESGNYAEFGALYDDDHVKIFNDAVFILTAPDIGKDATPVWNKTIGGVTLTAPDSSWNADYNGTHCKWWLRSGRSSGGVGYHDYGGGSSGKVYRLQDKSISAGVRPACWVDTTKVTMPAT